jgi:hypothetical protein
MRDFDLIHSPKISAATDRNVASEATSLPCRLAIYLLWLGK